MIVQANNCYSFDSCNLSVYVMNLRDLEYLVALAEHQHFRLAAEACYVSQPTLSGQIRKLEIELGLILLERTSRKVLVTASG